MKILLINPPSKTPIVRDMAGGLGFDGGRGVILPPLNLAYLAATLQNRGHVVMIIDSNVMNYKDKKVYQIVKDYKPDAIVANVSLPILEEDSSFIKGLREYTQSKIIAKTSINQPEILKQLLKKSQADFCIYGECDLSIEEIIKGEEGKGVAYLSSGEIMMEEVNRVEDLKMLPLPARNLLPNEKYRYILLGKGTTTMQTSRGCPFPCAYYCPYPLVQGKKWRARPPWHVYQEIEDITTTYKIRRILFRDAVFTLNKERIKEICDLVIKNGLDIEWWCETRIDYLDADLMSKMKEAGCKGINLGIETGDPRVLEEEAKIGVSLEELKNIKRDAERLGLRLHFLLIVGLPKETRWSLYETYRLIQTFRPESVGVTTITPYPGTPLYEEAEKKGWMQGGGWRKFGGHASMMRTDNLSCRDLKIAQRTILLGGFLAARRIPGYKMILRLLDGYLKHWASKSRT